MGRPQREVDPFRDELQTFRRALGDRIRYLRTTRGWSQEEFAANAHVHRTFAGSLERGEKNCSFHALVLIAQSFGITLSEMFTGIEDGESPKFDREPSRRKTRGYGDVDRRRILQEAAALERSARVLKELAQPQGAPSSAKPTGRRPRFKNIRRKE